ncbi:MAG: DUF5803 family protein [Halodesulfurarchaeum sp.]
MRRVLLALALVGLLGLAGCTGGPIDERALSEPATYDWNTTTDVHVNVTDGRYHAVVSIGNRTNATLALFGPGGVGGRAPLAVRAVQYRYPNGTVLNASALRVTVSGDRTVITAPVAAGKIAYTAQVRSNRLFVPVTVNGSYSVTLPAGTGVRAPVIGDVAPAGYEVTRQGDRVRVVWATPESEIITVDYYRKRNRSIFLGLLGLIGLIAVAGLLYFRSQIRNLERKTGDLAPENGDGR